MEYRSFGFADRVQEHPRPNLPTMSMLAMAQPVSHSAFRRECLWDENRQPEYAMRSRHGTERVSLPSIRQAFPELQLRIVPSESAPSLVRTPPTTSPLGAYGGALTSPEYVHSPNHNKRRRLSIGDETDDKARQVPRLYSPPSEVPLSSSRGRFSPFNPPRSATESWASSTRTSPHMSHLGGNTMPSFPSPVPVETSERPDSRPSLPRLPRLTLDREPCPLPRIRGPSSDEKYPHVPRSMLMHSNRLPMEPAMPPYPSGGYPMAYQHHPSRSQSLSVGAVHPYDRSPFTVGVYGPPHYPNDYARGYDVGGIVMNGDSKQRKRRGNLPKDTTDTLRAWFQSHVSHPYPSEDEKQELMRQTGLQMNQISNWFINARRRHLPSLLISLRAEADAAARGNEGHVIPSTERDQDNLPLSDGEGSNFDDDLDNLRHRNPIVSQRGSV